jgi:hypothetical protein
MCVLIIIQVIDNNRGHRAAIRNWQCTPFINATIINKYNMCVPRAGEHDFVFIPHPTPVLSGREDRRSQRDHSTGIVLNFGKIPFCFWRYSLVLVFTIIMTELINSFLVCYFARALGAKFPFISIPIFMTLCNVFGLNIFPRGKFFVFTLWRSSFGVVRLRGVFTMRGIISLLREMGCNMSNFVTYVNLCTLS